MRYIVQMYTTKITILIDLLSPYINETQLTTEPRSGLKKHHANMSTIQLFCVLRLKDSVDDERRETHDLFLSRKSRITFKS